MVRHLIAKRTPAWKALLAVAIAGGAILWHMLACIESPMAFSPSGKKLAFVTREPFGEKEPIIKGAYCFRLMVLEDFKKLRILEETTSHMLSCPAFSPDGKRICYLRIPLLSERNLDRLGEMVKKREKALEKVLSDDKPAWPTAGAATRPTTEPATSPFGEAEDLALPSIGGALRFHDVVMCRPLAPVQLVVRDASTYKVVSTVPLSISLITTDSDDVGMDFLIAYGIVRPQYSPDGKWVYFCSGNVAMRVNPSTGKQKILAAPAAVTALSPDGKTLAALQGNAVAFVRTDGQLTVYRRLKEGASLSGFKWKDNNTLAILMLREEKDKTDCRVNFLRRDGGEKGSITLNLPERSEKRGGLPQLAVAPNGKHMTLSFENEVFFLEAGGKILKHWKHEDDLMVQPAFTPDSRHVAMKFMSGEKKRTAAIVLFTPEGKEVSRVAIPKIKPGTVRRPH